ncbi:MAG: glutathione peroxidase [Candidatus Accumulibacter phosphatis]|nr:glutathione peroxidase [Candidatus Accumulibacter phosphatis]
MFSLKSPTSRTAAASGQNVPASPDAVNRSGGSGQIPNDAGLPQTAPVRETGICWFLLPVFVLSTTFFAALPVVAADSCPTLLNHSFPSLQDQKPQSLCQWQGKVLLVVNTASYCGFTSQYDGLEKLYARLKDRGLVVVGFPSNDFGDQEPGSNREIAEFCRLTYGVQFPMFAKATVVGKNASPLYAQLAKATGDAPQWNFHKYLIDRSGTRVLSFGSRVKPDDRELVARIDEFLGK